MDARCKAGVLPGPTPQGRELVFITRSAAHSKCVSGVGGSEGILLLSCSRSRGLAQAIGLGAGEGEEVKSLA